MQKSILNSFRLTVAEKRLGVYGVKVETADGDSVSHRWRSDDRVCLYSGSKTFTSLAVGMCIDDGKLRLDDRALSFFPEYAPVAAEGSDGITVRDLLHMASGKLVFTFTGEEALTTDWAELFFRYPVDKKPGTYFLYSNACTYMLGRIVEKISGCNVRDFLMPRLFAPFGIPNPQWHTCPRGHSLAATELFLTTDEFSRLGLTLLCGGVYHGQRIVSREYLGQAVADTVDCSRFNPGEPETSAGYGYQLWRCSREGVYRADGKYGQFSIVIPDKDAVVTVTSHEEHFANDIVRAVLDDIVPAL